jgi:hypothetical protein
MISVLEFVFGPFRIAGFESSLLFVISRCFHAFRSSFAVAVVTVPHSLHSLDPSLRQGFLLKLQYPQSRH